MGVDGSSFCPLSLLKYVRVQSCLNMNTNYYYSCVVDASPVFYFQAWGLVHSLMKHAQVEPLQIFVHYTEDVDTYFIEALLGLGIKLIPIQRFGDGKYCNKIAQLETPELKAAACVFLMDTDMIVLDELWELYTPEMIGGKVVDLANPDLATLQQIFDRAGFQNYPPLVDVDCGSEQTFQNNLNGGLYVVPGNLIATLSERWKKWALWLLEHIELLQKVGKENHVDQISFALATHDLSIPIHNLTKKYNYPVHLPIAKTGYPVVLHYHRNLSKVGLIEVEGDCDSAFQSAVQAANALIGACFNNKIFWSFRYKAFPELGSGVGSREHNLDYKRALLQTLKIEASTSILDVGCGDLEVLKILNLHHYTGVDVSPDAIKIARTKRPDLNFTLLTGENEAAIPCAETVLCMEVLIHQQTIEDYRNVINFLARKTKRNLIVSGYTVKEPYHDKNHMIKYHESLFDSLRNTGKFAQISKVGAHPGVDIILAETKFTLMEMFLKTVRRSLKNAIAFFGSFQ